MKRKNLDTKAVKVVCLAEMIILVVLLAYNAIFNMRLIIAIPTGGLIAYLLGTLFSVLGLYSIVEQMNRIEDQRESEQPW